MNVYEHIEDYLEGNLEGEMLQAFEEAIEKDEDLRFAVDNYEDAISIAKGLLEIDVMQSIESLQEEGTKVQPQPTAPHAKDIGWPMWVQGALVLIGIGLSIWYFVKQGTDKEIDTQVLYAQVYEEPMWPIERSGNISFESKGAEAYLNGDLKSAESFLIDSIANKDLGKYWLAEMYLKEGEVEKVDELLQDLSENKNIEDLDPQRLIYLKVLRHLQKGEYESAKQMASSLKTENYAKVKQLIDI